MTFTATAIAYLESKTPTWVKVCFALVIVGWMTPLKVREVWLDMIDTRVHAVITPMNLARDNELKLINQKIQNIESDGMETNAFVKALALQGLPQKRFEEITLAVDSKK